MKYNKRNSHVLRVIACIAKMVDSGFAVATAPLDWTPESPRALYIRKMNGRYRLRYRTTCGCLTTFWVDSRLIVYRALVDGVIAGDAIAVQSKREPKTTLHLLVLERGA